MNKTLLRKTVVGGVALLSLGVASPAFATGGTTPPTSTAGAVTTTDSTLTLAQLQAEVTAKIAARQAALNAKLAALPASPTAEMTDAEIKAKQALITILLDKLATLQGAVDAAKTIPAVQQALQDYWAPSLTELQARINVMITHQLAELDETIAKLPTSTLSTTQQAAAATALQVQKDKLVLLQSKVQSAGSITDVQAALKAAGIGDGRHKQRHDGEHRWSMGSSQGKHSGRHDGGFGLGLGGGLGGFGGSGYGGSGFSGSGFGGGHHD